MSWLLEAAPRKGSLMLILSRRVQEEIVIDGQNVRITIVKVKDGVVRIGVTAPKDVKILRGELLEDHTEDDAQK